MSRGPTAKSYAEASRYLSSSTNGDIVTEFRMLRKRLFVLQPLKAKLPVA